ncbi:unnamed protein product [Cuscuta europaea]|uniref:Cellulose synthase-like protein H1 n=1 Tax=Cuscuta europaea TaxID=41803 RepID=A0A9P0Z712_CUSEU|nr:unnamed protein product [Cuscuta europaea]
MAPKSPPSFPLYEVKFVNSKISRTVEVIILCLLLSLISYRLLSLNSHDYSLPWFLALVCESWFAFNWILTINIKWNHVETKTYPERLLKRLEDRAVAEFPAVDMFVTTADPELEPPIITVNTVLSLLAVDYPANKLACYVSDDGASPLTFFSLVEASKFAQIWVPFCKKFDVAVRAPFRYFHANPTCPHDRSLEFQHEWNKIKDEYLKLCAKIEDASKESMAFGLTAQFSVFSKIKRRDHSSIVKTRASGVMTNAPFMLNVDCDCFVNDPKVVLHAMCFLLGAEDEKDVGFVQFPQSFYSSLKDDPYGNQFKITMRCMVRGIAAIQGSLYMGTGCFHRRKVMYGSPPNCSTSSGSLYPEMTILTNSIEAAHEVANCAYEFGSAWGRNIGWIYGSTTEDVLTGLTIHNKGWKSAYCDPDPPAFLGCAPTGGPAASTQQKRWSTGLTEVLIGNNSPILKFFFGKLQFRQCLAYLWVMLWPVETFFEICNSLLPAFCIISNSSFQPKVNEAAIVMPASIFISYNLYTLSEYIMGGESIRAWWNNRRMSKLNASGPWLFGFLSAIFKVIGISNTVFEITKKEHTRDDTLQEESDVGGFTFDDSPIFIPATTILLVNIAALFIGLLDFDKQENKRWSFGEVICSLWVILMYWTYVKGLFGKGKCGIPFYTILRSGILALLFVQASRLV